MHKAKKTVTVERIQKKELNQPKSSASE